ncbi:MAG: hypothetical protein RLP14_08375 [Owenweeksia sp.]
MKLLPDIISVLSLIIVIFTIIFEGNFKSDKNKKPSFKNIKKEARKLTTLGYFLISLSIILGFSNIYVSHQISSETEAQYARDTTRIYELKNIADRNLETQLEQSKRDQQQIKVLSKAI